MVAGARAEADSAPPAFAARPVDAVALQRVQRRLATAAQEPWLHGEVARRMTERLALIRRRPECVAVWLAGHGGDRRRLGRVYPRARFVEVELQAAGGAGMAAAAAPWWSSRRWAGGTLRVGSGAELPAASAQLVWASMMLHLVPDPQAQMHAWHRALATDGFLMFATLGPGSLQGLREAYAARGWPPPHAPFVDMHDLGDMLLQAGFADPVMDQEQLELTWPDSVALLAELRTLGANADPARHAGLCTPRWRARLHDALQGLAGPDGRPRLGFEIVYGHAFKPAPRVRALAETTVSVDALRNMARGMRER
jgi:malonyl-CoA O-methyltransferase